MPVACKLDFYLMSHIPDSGVGNFLTFHEHDAGIPNLFQERLEAVELITVNPVLPFEF